MIEAQICFDRLLGRLKNRYGEHMGVPLPVGFAMVLFGVAIFLSWSFLQLVDHFALVAGMILVLTGFSKSKKTVSEHVSYGST